MKDLKNKSVLAGVVLLIILIVLAVILIIKREFPQTEQKNTIVIETLQPDLAIAEKPAAELSTEQESVNVNIETPDVAMKNNKELESLGLNRFYDSHEEYYTAPKYAEYKGEEMWQLEELFGYWDAYKLDAVNDLVRLPRVRTAFTNELTGSNKFYYYGGLNGKGQPHGRGVAVYEGNTYYCGDWVNGKRHGNGMWLQIFPDKTGTVNGVTGVIEHSYNGQWANDLPNGQGQDHYVYDLEEMQGEDVILNAIGNFSDGYYDGEMYIMTILPTGEYLNWEATAKRGVFDFIHNTYSTAGKLPVWERMEEVEDAFTYHWLSEDENANWGITGLKKAD